jgi:hypothetical protein
MDWRFWEHDPLDEGEKAREQHSQWLTRALAGNRQYPRIPVRPVVTGGFSRLMNRPHGPDLAGRWWEVALARVD